MENMEMKIETRADTQAKIAAKLGLDQPSVWDAVDRSKFPDDESYLDAVVSEQMKRSDPKYMEARRKLSMEYAQRREKAQLEENEKAYKEIRSAVKLDSVDLQEIDAQAANLAKRDLAAGRIGASGLGAAIENYARELTEKRKDSKASNQLFNAMLRGQR